MIRVVFRIQRDRYLTQLSRRFPDARIVVWCNFHQDVMEIQGAGAELGGILQDIRAHLDGARLIKGAGATTVLVPCPSPVRGSISNIVEGSGGLMLMPQVCQGGYEQFTILAFDEEQLPDILARISRLGSMSVVSKRRLRTPSIQEQFMVSAADLIGDLTAKQSEALLAAYDQGYYDVPRAATMQDVARRLKRPRTTMEEHVRKAEGKLVAALSPFIALRLRDEWPPPRGKPAKARKPGPSRSRPQHRQGQPSRTARKKHLRVGRVDPHSP